MHPIVMAALADEHRAELLQIAEIRRRSRTAATRRTTSAPLTRMAAALRAVLPHPRLENPPCCA